LPTRTKPKRIKGDNVMIARAMLATLALAASAATAVADWKPTKSVEFIVTSGPGGGTDQFARTIQSVIAKYKLMDQPPVVLNKGGGSGAEGFVYGKGATGDPHKVIFATNNEWLLPLVAKLAFKPSDLVPVASMALDEFLIWVPANSTYKDAQSFLNAAKEKPKELKMGGSQSKDTDEILVKMLEKATGARFTYIPYRGGGEAAVQLAGAHIDANTNNPNENIAQWRAGMVRPLCVFSPERMAGTGKVQGDTGWNDIPTCKEAGVALDHYQMPRTVFLPGKAPADAVAYYVNILKQVREKPEWADYISRNQQTDKFLTGSDFDAFIKTDEARGRETIKDAGWLVE